MTPGNAPRAESCDLVVRIVPDEHRLEATATLRLPATATAREALSFDLRSDMEVTRAEVEGRTVAARRVRDGTEPGSSARWELRPDRPVPARTPVTVTLAYAGGKVQGTVFYLGPEGCFAGGPNTDWYPRFHLRRSVGTLRFRVPRGFVVKASGVGAGHEEGGDESTYAFRVDIPSQFSFAAGRYRVARHAGRVPMTLFLLQDRAAADRIVAGCGQVLPVLEKEFGPYPYGEFAVVETPSPQSGNSGFGGASFEGFLFVDAGFLQQGFNLALFGHEIGHQWWGNLVQHRGERGAYMLDEALAQYGSLRCVEEIEGPAAAERYRRTGYPGYVELQCGRGAVLLASAQGDLPLSRLSGPFAHYIADAKGFLVQDLLARTIGRDRFRAALKRLTSTYAFRELAWDEFLKAVEQAAGRSLGEFYRQWFDRAGVPSLTLEWTQDAGRLRVVVAQDAPTYQLSLPLQITLESGRTLTQTIAVSGATTALTLLQPGAVRQVVLDPHYEVVHADPALRAEADALRFWMQGKVHTGYNRGDAALAAFQEGLRRLPEPDTYGVEFRLLREVGGHHHRGGRLDEARRAYEQALACAVRPAEGVPSVYLHLAQIARAQKDEARVAWAVRHAQNAERILAHPTGAGEQARALLATAPE